MADISTEELERIEQEFHSDTGSIKTIKEFVKPEDLYARTAQEASPEAMKSFSSMRIPSAV